VKKIIGTISVFLLFLAVTGCDNMPFTSQPSSPSVSKRSPAIAKVGSWTLTVGEFNRQIDAIIQANQGDPVVAVASLGLLARTFLPPYIQEIDLSSYEGKALYAELLVNLELLAQEAEHRGMAKDSDIAKDIRRAKVEILDFALLNEVLEKISVTPLEIEEFYENEYKKTLENVSQRKVREIIVSSESEATSILVELLQGADFATIARNRSIAETASKGGDLGYLVYQPSMKFQKFWEVALVLERGQLSSVFKDPMKQEYYIVKVEDIKKGEPESLSKIYDQLEFLLKQKKSVDAINSLIADIKNRVKVDMNADLL
jgi:peptidyl-prolyl cis-trans isomerase C